MIFVCHVISKHHVIKGTCDFMGGSQSWKVTTLPSLLARGMYYGSGNMMLLVVEGQDSACPRLNLLLLFIFKAHGKPCSHK